MNKRQQNFRSAYLFNVTESIESRVLVNKAIFDVTAFDGPWVIMANNKEERRERINRGILSFGLILVAPLITLPLANRFAMKSIAKLTPNTFSKEYNAIKISNKDLLSAEKTKEGIEKLEKELKIDLKPILKKTGGDYEKLRNKLINAKNFVLGLDILMIAGSFGHIGFYNNWQTQKKTGRKGFSAEFEMADKEIVENRAKNQSKNAKAKYLTFLSILGGVTLGLPLAVKHGLKTKSNTKFSNWIKKKAEIFDYKDGIFTSRWPMAIGFLAGHTGVFLASRDKSEMKDNAARSSTGLAIFFLLDLLTASVLGQAFDKHLKTKTINRNPENKNVLHKILPPVKTMSLIKKTGDVKTKNAATAIFWLNFVGLSAFAGFMVPALINKVVKKDVSKDEAKQKIK